MASMRLLCACAATAAALVAPAPRTTRLRTNARYRATSASRTPSTALFDVLERASTSGAVVDFTPRRARRPTPSPRPTPSVQAGAAAVALAGGAASVFRPPPKFPTIYGSWFGDKMSADMRTCISARFTERPHGHGGAAAHASAAELDEQIFIAEDDLAKISEHADQ